jgi:hypothetical protein
MAARRGRVVVHGGGSSRSRAEAADGVDGAGEVAVVGRGRLWPWLVRARFWPWLA